ncbi:type II toxin-antitoxin system HicB family antitoxin [Priestia megaterium]|uniref:type II toxin-antitoxin system HicB family antitoxin n=1 Tax=Priestia megaterium TaxID=1404 RepID=UPI003CEAEF2F
MPFYSFYGVFEPNERGYSVSFPDLKGCLTCGDDMGEALVRAKYTLEGYLLEYEDLDKGIPVPSSLETIKANMPEDANVILVEINTEDSRGIERL